MTVTVSNEESGIAFALLGISVDYGRRGHDGDELIVPDGDRREALEILHTHGVQLD
jgi:hypothetical protein